MIKLFEPQDISRSKPKLTPISTELYKEVYEILNNAYTLPFNNKIILETIHNNNPTKVNTLVTLSDRKHILKRIGIENKERLEWESTISDTLNKEGIPLTKIIKTSTGNCYATFNKYTYTMYDFEEGTHFSGKEEELDTAANFFSKLSACADKITLPQPVEKIIFLETLSDLFREAVHKNDNSIISNLCLASEQFLESALEKVRANWKENGRQPIITHLDYHPSNLITRDGRVVCILDLETINQYNPQGALGFASYKTIRHMLIGKDPEERVKLAPNLVECWQNNWNAYFPHLAYSQTEIGIGASYRVLFLIYLILHRHLKENNTSSDYDLEKQIVSLSEIEEIYRNE